MRAMLLNAALCLFPLTALFAQPYLRLNQVGYQPPDRKTAVVLSETAPSGDFQLRVEGTNRVVWSGRTTPASAPGWGHFHHTELDFSAVREQGRYFFSDASGKALSPVFAINNTAYAGLSETLLVFMRQQRCGYNPFLDMVCHQRDGRSMYGPMPDSSYVDASGGWHDAGDQLKYLITASYATAQMLMAYEMYPGRFADRVDALGRPQPNGVADVLDEAKWGLDWLLKLHPAPDQLIHQVADDRDHKGWKMPDNDPSDYGWGPNSYRVAYFADGAPQGLLKYKSKATGVANLAGRSAAALALGARVWKKHLKDELFAGVCLRAARSLYALGQKKEGYQQGNSYGAPYRYTEDSWADDMEWGAAELYKTSGEKHYREEAKQYAQMAGAIGWMPLDTADHYRFYPFVNPGHYALYRSVDRRFKKKLAGYYREGLESCLARSRRNVYAAGIPFIWCSNNLTTALATQIILYEEMTGDLRYHDLLLAQRDWLFGRNPWGTAMFTGIPAGGEYPEDVHTSIWAKLKQPVPGGLIDGPVYASIYNSLLGLTLNEADEFAVFQNSYVVYHDDIGDYSTNEPTMDGTAGAVLMMAYFAKR